MLVYDREIEEIILKTETNLKFNNYNFSKRMIALLLIQQDEEIVEMVKDKEPENYIKIKEIVDNFIKDSKEDISYLIQKSTQQQCKKIISEVVSYNPRNRGIMSILLNKLTVNPLTGIPLLLLVLYFGFYKFVGVFGAGIIVNYIEKSIFNEIVNPYINFYVNNLIPSKVSCDLIANDYGILTFGLRYSIAIVLPIVGCFFFMFSIIEDSGYLPRISFLLDRLFKKIGLNGRAVIPMVLGFGCDTMATMVSRTLETKRERIIATFLLALAIPCSAQLGVILALLSVNPLVPTIWVLFMFVIFILVGYLTSKFLRGKRSEFYMEIPPLRLPKLLNILKKTYIRMYWYFREVLPIFLFASAVIWIGNLTGIFDILISMTEPIVSLLGLPNDLAKVFLFGFFRRDYGAAGLFDMQSSGLMNGRQLVVAAATLTLFVPCVAQFAMMIKERGLKVALAIACFIFPFAFFAGFLLNKLLLLWGIDL